jgi:hypothetical protein
MAHDSLGVLRERIKGTYSLEEVRAVADTICNGFDSALHKQRGGVYKQGRDLSSMKNLEQFVSSRPEVIEHLKAESKVHARTAKSYDEFRTLLDGSLHKHLALLQQMLEGRSINHSNIGDAADYAGGLATSAGVSYDMCGYVVNSPEKPQSQSTLGTGFESLMAYAGVRLQCPNNRCGEFVVVDIRYLKQGVLHCTACLHTLDVCGDTRKAERIKAEALKKRKETNAKRAEKQKRTEWRHKKRNTSRHVTL